MTKKRISVSLSEELTEALKKIVKKHPEAKSKSGVVSDALEEYLPLRFPEFTSGEPIRGPKVLTYFRGTRKRAPSVSLRRTKLDLPRWRAVES